ATLHEAYASYLETNEDPARVIDLLAYHYDRSENLPKRREALTRAGDAAAARFANVEAVDYLTRALALISAAAERYPLLSTREHVYDVQGARDQQHADLQELAQSAEVMEDPSQLARVWIQKGWLAERTSDHASAQRLLEQATERLQSPPMAAPAHD